MHVGIVDSDHGLIDNLPLTKVIALRISTAVCNSRINISLLLAIHRRLLAFQLRRFWRVFARNLLLLIISHCPFGGGFKDCLIVMETTDVLDGCRAYDDIVLGRPCLTLVEGFSIWMMILLKVLFRRAPKNVGFLMTMGAAIVVPKLWSFGCRFYRVDCRLRRFVL